MSAESPYRDPLPPRPCFRKVEITSPRDANWRTPDVVCFANTLPQDERIVAVVPKKFFNGRLSIVEVLIEFVG